MIHLFYFNRNRLRLINRKTITYIKQKKKSKNQNKFYATTVGSGVGGIPRLAFISFILFRVL